MKYTVVIRQPVAVSTRQVLEKQLMERFGLTGDQAQRLSARRNGRLMKPTSRARAELLLNLFQSVGADVNLEEVRQETGLLTEPFQGMSAVPTPKPAKDAREAHDDAPLAPLMTPSTRTEDVFRVPTAVWPDIPIIDPNGPKNPTLSVPATGSDWLDVPLTTSSKTPAVLEPPAIPELSKLGTADDPLGFLLNPAVPVPAVSPVIGAAKAKAKEATPAMDVGDAPTPDELVANSQPVARNPNDPLTTTDVWTDFTGSLTLTDSPASTLDPKITSITPIMMPAADDDQARKVKRGSLTRQLMLGTLAPLALSSALTLGLLSLTLPTLQKQTVQQQATTLTSTIGAGLAQQNQAAQISKMVKNGNVGFVRVELANGNAVLRNLEGNADDPMNKAIAQWQQSHPDKGTIKLNGKEYVTSRLSFAADGAGQFNIVPNNSAQFSHRVTVGLPTENSGTLRNALLLVLAVSLLGLLLAAALAARAAKQITDPIDRLVKVADAISMGDLTRPVQAERNDEIGDLAQALERMRLSLEAAMERLRRRSKRGN